MSAPAVTIIDFLRLFEPQFSGPSWAAWRVVLRALFALPMDDADLRIFQQLTGRTSAPTVPASELWAICGRRGGKTRLAAAVTVYLSTCRQYQLAPGEKGTVMLIASDKKQARVARRYVEGLLRSTPTLEQLIVRQTRELIELSNHLVIEIQTASYRAVRGYTIISVVCDELAFWPTDDAADSSDRAILEALRPAMATVPEAVLLCLSSPYARKGELWRAHRDHFGRNDDPVLVVQAPTRLMNPSVPQAVIDRAYAEDEASARAEYGAEFRTDVEAFLTLEAITACVVEGRRELPYAAHHQRYVAFLDAAGGSGGDSFTWAVAHEEWRTSGAVIVLDLLREVRPPFSPKTVCEQCAADLSRYGLYVATSDRWGGQFPVEEMSQYGITVYQCARTKSELYLETLSLLNSRQVELLDHPRLVKQLTGLERRTRAGGRDAVDHAPNQHDDIANAACGAAVELLRPWGERVVQEDVLPPAQSWFDVFGVPKPVVPTTPVARPVVVRKRGTAGKALTNYDLDARMRE